MDPFEGGRENAESLCQSGIHSPGPDIEPRGDRETVVTGRNGKGLQDSYQIVDVGFHPSQIRAQGVKRFQVDAPLSHDRPSLFFSGFQGFLKPDLSNLLMQLWRLLQSEGVPENTTGVFVRSGGKNCQ